MSPKYNSGKTHDGGIRTDYGKDDSDYAGSATAERGGGMGGGVTNVSHSLGTSATNKKK